jgi:hypothetical protein
MKKGLFAVIAVAAVSALIGCGGGDTTGGTYRFTFQPPDSVTFGVDFSKLRVTSQGDNSMTDSSWTHTEQQITIDSGQYFSKRVTDVMVQYHDGELFEDPILEIFARQPVTYVIDTTGEVRDVRGYEELFARLDSILGPDTAAMLRQMVTPEVLKTQEIDTWNERFVPFVGAEMAVGKVQVDTSYANLPIEGRLEQFHLTELLDTVRIDDRLCGKISIVSGTDPAALAEMSGRSVEEIAGLLALSDEQLATATNRQAATGSQRLWVLEFETMLSRSEDSHFSVHYFELSDTGVMVRSEIVETQSKVFTYPAP